MAIPEPDETAIRLREELDEWVAKAQDVFDRGDFVADLWGTLEAVVPIPGAALKVKFCRLSSAEVTAAEKLAEADESLKPTSAMIFSMIKKAYEGKTFEEVRKMIEQEIPTEVAGYLGSLILAKNSVFFTKEEGNRLNDSFLGLTSTPTQPKTQS